jgi:hypothetical protein
MIGGCVMRGFQNDMFVGFAIPDNHIDGKEIKVAKSNERKPATSCTYSIHIKDETVDLGVVRILQLINALQILIADLPIGFMPAVGALDEK